MTRTLGRLRPAVPTFAALVLAIISCDGGPSEPSPAEGAWSFAAGYGNGYNCTIAGAILTLQLNDQGWTGSLTGGQHQCAGIPGEFPVPETPMDATLDSIVVRGDSVTFRLEGGSFVARGTLSESEMAGIVEVAISSPLNGTWTAVRLQP